MWPHVNTTVATFFVNIGIKMSSLTHFHGVFFLIIGKAFYRFVEKLVEMNVDIMWRYQSIFQLGVSFWHVACLIWLLEISLPIWPDLVSQLDRVGFPFSEWLSQSTQRLLHIDSVDMQLGCSTLQMIINPTSMNIMCFNIQRWNLRHWRARQQRSPAPECAQRRRPPASWASASMRQNIKCDCDTERFRPFDTDTRWCAVLQIRYKANGMLAWHR